MVHVRCLSDLVGKKQFPLSNLGSEFHTQNCQSFWDSLPQYFPHLWNLTTRKSKFFRFLITFQNFLYFFISYACITFINFFRPDCWLHIQYIYIKWFQVENIPPQSIFVLFFHPQRFQFFGNFHSRSFRFFYNFPPWISKIWEFHTTSKKPWNCSVVCLIHTCYHKIDPQCGNYFRKNKII